MECQFAFNEDKAHLSARCQSEIFPEIRKFAVREMKLYRPLSKADRSDAKFCVSFGSAEEADRGKFLDLVRGLARLKGIPVGGDFEKGREACITLERSGFYEGDKYRERNGRLRVEHEAPVGCHYRSTPEECIPDWKRMTLLEVHTRRPIRYLHRGM